MHSLTNHEGQGYHELTAVPAMAYCNRETTAWRNIRSSVWLHLRPWRCVSALKGITSSAERGQALSKPTLATLLSQNENKQYSKVGWNHLSLLVGYAWKYSRLFRCRCSKESGGGGSDSCTSHGAMKSRAATSAGRVVPSSRYTAA